MRKVIVFEWMSLDGVVQAPAYADEDTSSGRTYDVFAAHWPKASQEEQALAQPLNTLPKYVASRTLKEPLAWQNSMLLGDNITESVAKLRRQDGKDLLLSRLTERMARRAAQSGNGLSSAETVALLGRLTGIVAAACLIFAVMRIASAQAKRSSAG